MYECVGLMYKRVGLMYKLDYLLTKILITLNLNIFVHCFSISMYLHA